MTRSEHMAWAKQRAIKALDENGPTKGPFMAWTGFKHDMGKHEETRSHVAIGLGDMMFSPIFKEAFFGGNPDAVLILSAPGIQNMRHFIEGFN